MDMDGIGTFALFLSSGALGMGLIWLAALRMKLKNQLERERLQQSDGHNDLREEMHERFERQEANIGELQERLDFTERLLSRGRAEESARDQ